MMKQRRRMRSSVETTAGGRSDTLFPPIFYRWGMFFLPALPYAQSIFTTEGIPNEPDSHRQLHCAQAQGTKPYTGAAGAAARRVQQDHFKMGERSFP